MPRTMAAVARNIAYGLGGGQAAHSVYFPGGTVNQGVFGTGTTTLALGNVFTFMAWVKVMSTFAASGNNRRMTLAVFSGNAAGLNVEYGNGSLAANCPAFFMNGSWPAITASPVPIGTWHHLAMTKNGPSVGVNPYNAYLNGVQIGMTKINDNDYSDSNSGITFGCRGGGQMFHGNMKDICLYSRVLAVAEIKDAAFRRVFATGSRVLLYPFSEGTGGAADAFGLQATTQAPSSGAVWSNDSPFVDRVTSASRTGAASRTLAI